MIISLLLIMLKFTRFIIFVSIICFCCLWLLSCFSNDEQNPVIETVYQDGRKDSVSYNEKMLKHGRSSYYSKSGTLDSTVFYRNGKRHGLTTVYGQAGDIITYEFVNDEFVKQKEYDSAGTLIYEQPLDVSSLPKTTYRLKSNRPYFDQELGDTIVFINSKLPEFNYGFEVSGALLDRLKAHNVRAIRVTKKSSSLKEILIKIEIFSRIDGSSRLQVPDRVDTLLIPVK